MDLRLTGRVVWRFRFVAVVGVLLALGLALLAFVRVGFEDGRPDFEYREREVFESRALLFVTQAGFPWGRSVIESEEDPLTTAPASGTRRRTPREPRFADAERFGSLAILYASLATSDPVRELLLREGPVNGRIEASPVLASETLDESVRSQLRYETPLPLVRVSAGASSAPAAERLATREVDAFLRYIDQRQDASRIRPNDRVVISVLRQPTEAEVVDGRSLLYPALVLVAVLIVTAALILALENIWPRSERGSEEEEPRLAPVADARRRSA